MNFEVFVGIFQTIVLIVAFLGSFRLIKSGKSGVKTVFFSFAMASLLLSNLYWVAYDLLRPDTRMPFAANEIGEWAGFLLLGALLEIKPMFGTARRVMLWTALFTAANAALWIVWSGEWVQDILTGLALGYFLCSLTARIKVTGAFSTWEWSLLAMVCAMLIVAQAVGVIAEKTIRYPLDLFSYFLLFAMSILFLIRAVPVLRHGKTEHGICRSFAVFAWNIITMYMSAGYFYVAANLLCTISNLMMLLAIRKEAKYSASIDSGKSGI